MAQLVLPRVGFQDAGSSSTPQLCTFMTAISGVSDELERARLTVSGLSGLIRCRLSGMALLDHTETTWTLTVQKDAHPLDSLETELIRGELNGLFENALRCPGLLIATSDADTNGTRTPSSIETVGVRSLAVAPVRTVRHNIGMILVGRETLEGFTREENVVLSTLAEHSAIGLENLRLSQALKQYSRGLQVLVDQRTEQLSQAEQKHRALLEINNAIIASLDRESLFQAVTKALRKVLHFDRASLTLLDPERDVLRVHALVTPSPGKRALAVGVEFPREASVLAPVFQQKRPIIRRHLDKGERIGIETSLVEEGIRSYVAVPLLAKGRPFGTLNLGSHAPEEYSTTDAGFLTEIGQQVALAVENMLAYEEIGQLKARLEEENLYLQEEITTEHGFGDIVGQSPALRSVLRQIELVAPTDASVLVLGESGTGKELVAREVHKRSRRRNRPLVRVNCASIPRELYESEFFGHVKGAFTGALKDRAGRFEVADGGTLFLDEVGEIPLELQSKLLRALQEQEYERVGDERTRQVDVRIIVATNRDLVKEVKAGRFREDLYYRLNVYPIMVAPLRRRKEDIPLLAGHLVEQAAKKLNCPKPRLPQAQIAALQNYDWPGNIRELQNVIERAVIMSRGNPLQFDLPSPANEETPGLRPSPATVLLGENEVIPEAEIRRRERENLLTALRLSNWRVYGPEGAAEHLGVRPTTLVSRMKKLGLTKPR